MKEDQINQLMNNLDYLRERSCLAFVHKHITFDQIFDLLDHEFKIANCALKSKIKPDYEFLVLKVDLRKLRYHSITISSQTGFTMILKKEHMEYFNNWVEKEAVRKAVEFRKWMNIGGSIYQTSDGDGNWSISDEMRFRHKGCSSPLYQGKVDKYHIMIEKARKALESYNGVG
jgi:hypothetical protein